MGNALLLVTVINATCAFIILRRQNKRMRGAAKRPPLYDALMAVFAATIGSVVFYALWQS